MQPTDPTLYNIQNYTYTYTYYTLLYKPLQAVPPCIMQPWQLLVYLYLYLALSLLLSRATFLYSLLWVTWVNLPDSRRAHLLIHLQNY